MIDKKKGWQIELKNKTSFLPNDAKTGERLFCFKNNIKSRPNCKQCNINKVKFYYDRYRDFCSVSCSRKNKNTQEKYKDTCLKTFGVENPSMSEDIKKQKRNTCFKNHGVENGFQLIATREQTYYNRTGYKNPSQNPNSRAREIIGLQNKYGITNVFQLPESIEKRKKSFVDKAVEIREKTKETCKKRYGAEHPNKNGDMLEKNQKYKTKSMIIDGNIILFQGYENVAWKILLEQYNSNDIISKKGEMPEILYTHENKQKRYFPDFYIPIKNLIIEVKSTWTIKKYYEINQLKKQACINYGFNFQFWICSNNTLLEILEVNDEILKMRY